MNRKSHRRRRLVQRIALGFAVAAIAAQAAQAAQLGDGSSVLEARLATEIPLGAIGPAGVDAGQGSTSVLDARLATEIPLGATGSEQAKHIAAGPSSVPLASIPGDLSGLQFGREFGPASFTARLPAPQTTSDGFDYRDAGIGAAIAAAVLLTLMAGALLVGKRRRHLARATALSQEVHG